MRYYELKCVTPNKNKIFRMEGILAERAYYSVTDL